MGNIDDNATTPAKSSVASQAADQIRDRAGDAAEALKGVGAKASSTVRETASSTVQDVSDKAAGLFGTASDKVNDALGSQKAAGAERVKGISSAIRRAADELEHEIPPAATYIRRAADEIDSMADAVQRRDVRQLLGDVQSLARRQPAAFLGATVLGGFAVMRLLKAPTAAQHPDASLTASATAGTALVPVGVRHDIKGGSGDPGGISPVAPGFEKTSGSASAMTPKGTKAGLS